MRAPPWLAIAALSACLGSVAHAATTLKLVEVITSPSVPKRSGPSSRLSKTQSDTNVEIISLPWGQSFEKLPTMVAAGDSPMWSRCPIPGWRFTQQQPLENLEPYLKSWEHTGELNQRTLQLAA